MLPFRHADAGQIPTWKVLTFCVSLTSASSEKWLAVFRDLRPWRCVPHHILTSLHSHLFLFPHIFHLICVLFKVTDTNEGGWFARRDIHIATLPSLIILCTHPLPISHASAERSCARATSWTGMPVSACSWSNRILYTPAVWSECVEPGAQDVLLACFNTPDKSVTLNADSVHHASALFTQHTTKQY